MTLSKALGAQGGAVLGSPVLREHLVNTARSFIFDTALAPAPAAAAATACRVIAAEQLAGDGVLVGCFRPPSVPDGISRLRLTARADLDPEQARRAGGLVAASIARVGST